MIDLVAHNLAPIMFFSMAAFLLIGYPISFALAANGLLFFLIGVFLTPYSTEVNLGWNLLQALGDRVFGIMRNDVLLAIPFFTFMGIVLERSRMAEDLLETVGQLFGPVRGGLAMAVILVGALLAATIGVVAASVISMGLISLPIMLRYGYDRKLATGVIAAAGTLTQILPPSLVLIVLADQLGRSVGDMYKAALLPGLGLTGLYLLYVIVLSFIRPRAMPALPPEVRTLGPGVASLLVAFAIAGLIYMGAQWLLHDGLGRGSDAAIWSAAIAVIALMLMAQLDARLGLNLLSHLARQVIIVMIPPLALIFVVLGTIFLGIATPTEAGAMGAVGALVLAGLKRRLNRDVVNQALLSTVRLSSFVMFILLGATVFSLTYYSINGHIWVKDLLTALPGGQYGFLLAVSAIIFFLAFFLDFFELSFVIVPLLIPAANELGIDLVWFGIILAVVMQTSFLTPPVGFALFYLRSVAPRRSYLDKITGGRIPAVSTGDIYRGAVPFVGLQIVMVGLVIAFPQMVMHYRGPAVDTSNIRIHLPSGGLGGVGGSPFGQGAPAGGGNAAPRGLGTGPGVPNFGGSPAATPAPQPENAAPEAPTPAAPGLGSPPPGLGGN